uniref:Chlorophyll synthase n=1 Tax=Pyramimonas obovata TaxID=1411642 RepID=A0A7S0QNV0_9CHLO|eukprot:CAMPEP_0118929342 /NCGR_PEP_ID=MMETSP1169-20130426/6370_1 /TAXON_ID=36882 /ORGANISM="Pyramimonas obovata, Strain CCMP722" /LENGTH=412 /DNA_ID=CAMNT_0006871515 /DNA_START=33 /DNA_END=1271 /DNA_ORIENTATION=-
MASSCASSISLTRAAACIGRTSSAAGPKALGSVRRPVGTVPRVRMSAGRRSLRVRAEDPYSEGTVRITAAKKEKAKAEEKAEVDGVLLGAGKGSADVQQILGFRQTSATDELPKWRIQIQLMKPGTWVPVCWGVMCGAAASGNYHWIEAFPRDFLEALACVFLSGPCLTGFTQVINDWYDRDIDAINEPNRPIPSGRISGTDVAVQASVLLIGGWALALKLDQLRGHEFPTLLTIALFGSFISYIYSAPPLKLKANGWQGTYALGASYIALPWWAGQALFGELTPEVMVMTLAYSIAGLGIAIVNDFKSIEGDTALGLKSLPVEFGVETAKWITVGTIDAFQLLIAAYLFNIGSEGYGTVLLALIIPQVYAQFRYFLVDPIKNDVKYQASAQPFLVFGILTTALAIGHNPLH